MGDVLKELRIERGLGLNQLALKANVQKSMLSLVERNKQSGMSEKNLAKVAHALGTTSDAIKARAGIRPRPPKDLEPHVDAYSEAGWPLLRLGSIIKERRKSLGWTQRTASDSAGVGLGRYQIIENGGRKMPGGGWQIADPTDVEITRICDALGIVESYARSEAGLDAGEPAATLMPARVAAAGVDISDLTPEEMAVVNTVIAGLRAQRSRRE